MERDPSKEIVVKASAKVNLVLRVLDRRSDGYHDLWSLMQTVGLKDELRIRVRRGSFDITLRCDDASLPTDARNLIHRAAVRVVEASGQRVGVDIDVTKRIPVGGGLGGGSSDAAATILALNRLMGLEWSPSVMAEIGMDLGSDVPFFFHAPTAIIRGRGEDISPIRLSGQRWIVLVNPGFAIETRWAYEQLSRVRSGIRPLSRSLQAVTQHGSLAWEDVIPMMENDFEEPLGPTYPALAEIKQSLLAAGAEAALLSGSGATVFGVFRHEHPAVQACRVFHERGAYRAYAVPSFGSPLSSVADSSPASGSDRF